MDYLQKKGVIYEVVLSNRKEVRRILYVAIQMSSLNVFTTTTVN